MARYKKDAEGNDTNEIEIKTLSQAQEAALSFPSPQRELIEAIIDTCDWEPEPKAK